MRAPALLLTVVLVATPVVACGGDGEAAKTVTTESVVTVEKRSDPPKRAGSGKDRGKSPPESTPAPAPPKFVNCDSNIEAKVDTTTCPFAQNVFWTYWTNAESTDPAEVWSPAAQARFTTTCELAGTEVVCNTSDNATVKFPQAAVDGYSQEQADAYASTHDLGPDDGGVPPPPPPPSEDCQGYDPCITPGADVDCEGGEGNGPRYADGPVYVDGADPYGLDSNYDGVGCEYG